jgi:hypothetical protein
MYLTVARKPEVSKKLKKSFSRKASSAAAQ